MKIDTGRSQRGAATLIVTVILVVVASLTVLVVSKSAINEQKRTGIDVRSKAVYAAANGALEYGIYQLMVLYNDGDITTPKWLSGSDDGAAAADDIATLTYDFDGDGNVDAILTEDIDAFNLATEITYKLITAEDEHPAIIEIIAPVVGATESHVKKTVSVRVLREDLGTGSTFDSPPLVIEKCIPPGAALGTPDIVSDEVAIATIQGDSSSNTCLDPGHFEINGDGVVGEPTNDTTTISVMEALLGSDEAWVDIKAASDIEAESGVLDAARTAFYVTETTPWGKANTQYGSLTSPVVVFFAEESGCPSINGTPVIYGLVYFQAPDGGCENQGAGAATVFGTVAYEGDLKKINANIVMVDTVFDTGGEGDGVAKVIVPLPGSWRDFEPAGI